ncbi:hypothetical protein M6B38_389465 [Iris pallida]|uniref:Uncharacterized protein n=1 Tax=Iris pallida TaxID=29817 RepID=A0AAX6G139_IRIPA|nr:hypothetical protein M6B38_389465 [Iris pallida]
MSIHGGAVAVLIWFQATRSDRLARSGPDQWRLVDELGCYRVRSGLTGGGAVEIDGCGADLVIHGCTSWLMERFRPAATDSG